MSVSDVRTTFPRVLPRMLYEMNTFWHGPPQTKFLEFSIKFQLKSD